MPFAALSMFHLASLIFGVAAAIGSLRLMPEIGPARAAFIGVAVLLLGLLLAEGVARRRERRILQQRFTGLQRVQSEQAAVVDKLRKQVAFLTSDRDQDDLVNEMRMVRSQLGRLVQRQKPEPVIDGDTPLSGEPLLQETLNALKENRMDLYLQPVVRLPQRRVAFNECLTRLRGSKGAIITPDQYMPIAEKAGSVSVIDNLSMFRCVQTLKTRRGPDFADIGFFCNLSVTTLEDGEFFDQFAEFLVGNRDMAGRIIFEVEAETLLNAEHTVRTNLDTLSRLGFRLSADHITSLDTDFAELARRGAAFVKVDTEALLGDAQRTARSVYEALSAERVILIASKVETEQQVVQLVEADIRLAQGYLFGEPRPLKEDPRRSLAAA